MRDIHRRIALLAVVTSLAALTASAGTISLTWNPVSDSDLAGYRVYWGTSQGAYTNSQNVGNVTSATINGLTDCTTWYLAVKAYDTTGNLSVNYSNAISGWPRPTVTLSAPSAAEQGRTLSLNLTGTNFMSGATVQTGNAGITVNSVTVNSCTQITANVTVGGSAAAGATNLDVTNPDQVFGSGSGLFTVQAATIPTVSSTSPANGATGVSVSVHPTVTFSEAMLASSVTSSTVRILDGQGAAVAQAAGSPSLSGDGLTATVVPAANLTMGATYKIQVVGGASGVLDLANHSMTSTYNQATGFSTTPDTAPPTISSVQSGSVTSSTAQITWTTNETADSQVFYRKSGQTGYQQTDVDATQVTSHSVTLQGLDPSATYQYHVRSADAAGNASTSSPDQTFTTSASTYSYLRSEAEAGILVAPVRIQSGSGGFGGSWIDTPSGTATGTASSPSGTATLGINIPTAGTWYLWLRIYGPSTSSDTWFESVDGAARQTVTASTTGAWTWVAGRSYTLTQGLHTVELGGRDAQARADQVLLTNDVAFRPTAQPVDDQTPPAAPSGFAATPSNLQNTLTWTDPSDADFASTVLRYRIDGRYPTSPVDGFAVTQEPAAPGTADSYVHAGLTNGTVYSYSAFAVDANGNVSVAAHAQGTPTDNVPPAAVTNLRRSDTRP
ncbi:MAG: fibronectin type III domain-containing protein [Acidobacteriia bacterium]|nr:fibronectin type III domain-containing protein [Terriglobia bacterium]